MNLPLAAKKFGKLWKACFPSSDLLLSQRRVPLLADGEAAAIEEVDVGAALVKRREETQP